AVLPLGEAVALFRERAQAVRPEGVFAAAEVAEICERVDCLPLAIELAAVQVRMLSLRQLLEHLTPRLPLLRGGAPDLPARQRAMEDAIGWSYDLLTPPQQRYFRALGVFVGGWSLAAAQAVCWDTGALGAPAPPEALLMLAALVDASLVQAEMAADGSVRFHLLELMREYALERLRAAGEDGACRRRHAIYFARLAETAAALGPGAVPLVRELPNARAALEWAEERQAAELGLRLAGFARLWHIQGQISEAVRWQERMLALDLAARERGEPTAPRTLRVARLYGLARTLLSAGQLERADALAAEALDLAQRSDDQSGIANAYTTRGLIAQASDRLEQAATAFAASYAHARLARESSITTLALVHLTDLARLRGDSTSAATHLEAALASARATGNEWELAMITTMLGQLAQQRQDYAQARAHYRASLALLDTFGSPTYIAWCLESLAATLCAQGHHAWGACLCAAAAAMRQHASTPLPPAEREAFEQTIATARAALGDPAFRAQWEAGSALTREAAVADTLERLAPR
ncbi:MAG TPA: hypothetical protein VGN32_19275, partial [Ktedonobacterales bacterium]|nr:hypothetical protein [Ktedonobacterales bacterium]